MIAVGIVIVLLTIASGFFLGYCVGYDRGLRDGVRLGRHYP